MKSRTNFWGLLLVAGVLTLLGKLSSAQSVPPGEAWVKAPPAVVAAPPAGLGEVEVSGRLSQSELRVGENMRFWLTIRNSGGGTIREVTLSPESFPGYMIDARCWCPSSGASCIPSENSGFVAASPTGPPAANTGAPASPGNAPEPPNCDRIVTKLHAGQTLSVWGDLRAQHRQERRTLYAVVSFQGAAGVTSQVAVPLGEVTVRNLLDVLLSLVWPSIAAILVALGSYIFKRWQDQRAQKTQTWNKMLSESHRLALAYYAPIESAARLFIEHVERCKNQRGKGLRAKANESLRQAFYWWMLFGYRYRAMTLEVGAFWFKDRVGEELVVACFNACLTRYDKRDEARIRNYRRVRDALSVHETLDSFLQKSDARMDTVGMFQDEWRYFETWVQSGECAEALSYLEGFRAVLYYELNRPYEYWYGRTETIALDRKTEQILIEAGKQIAAENNMPEFPRKVLKYLKEGKKERQKG